MPTKESDTIYERVARLEDEVAVLRAEMDFLKHALRNTLARQEIKMLKKSS